MRYFIVFLVLLVGFSSCKSSKKARTSKKTKSQNIEIRSISASTVNTKQTSDEGLNNTYSDIHNTNNAYTLQDSITDYAKTFEGVKYRWGGITSAGMDCSGLVFESFRAHDIYLPRISRDIAKKGTKIELNEVKKGDLLFFITSHNKRNTINHVGLVVEVINNDILFIHSTTKSGVITTLLSETYWSRAFIEARRYL